MPEPYIIHGIASVSTVNGKPYVDSQGDVISTAELVKAAHRFMSESRSAGVMHMRGPNGEVVKAGRVVSSCVMTDQLQRALGISLGCEPWIVGVEITDPRVAKAIKSGQLAGFSIAGRGYREPVEIEE
jgi:hypothetical protein